MPDKVSRKSLAELVTALEAVTQATQQKFANLVPRQLNWKPSAEKWSIAQCFDHLMVVNESYFPIFDRAAKGEKRNNLWESMPLLPRFFGGLLIKSLDPASTRRMKSPKSFQPSSSEMNGQIIDRFISQQQNLAIAMAALEGQDLQATKVTSPALKLITYSLRDACTIIVVHEQRHLQQAERVLALPEFPKP